MIILFVSDRQWTACPTKADGSGADCNKAPSLSSNSWGGGQGDTWYDSVVRTWHTAGIVPIFALGNSGSGCGTANSPGDMTNVIGVSSTNANDEISASGSRGPAQNGAIKPDIVAPGQNIRSAWNSGDNAYQTISGTRYGKSEIERIRQKLTVLFTFLSNLHAKGFSIHPSSCVPD